MKKKSILIASIIGAAGVFAAATAITLNTTNIKSNSVEVESSILDESTESEDEIFSDGLMSVEIEKKSANQTLSTGDIKTPAIGRQYYYDSSTNTVSIRFYAAIASADVNAVWTRTLYNSDGTVNSALSNAKKESSVAYSTLIYKDSNGDTHTLNATDVEDEDGNTGNYNYFVLYTLKNVSVDTYGSCSIDAKLTLSNSTTEVSSKTGSVTTNSTATMSSYTMELDMNNTYEGSTTSAGNGQRINGKVKTIYTTEDTELDTTYITPVVDGEGVTSFTATGFTAGEAGEQRITITSGSARAEYSIYVLDSEIAYQDSDSNYVCTVDQSYTGTIGAVNGSYGNMFTTISDALDFLQNTDFVSESANKILNIGAGYYYEKLEITTPNLTINGSGTLAHGTYADDENYDATAYSNATIIEFDTRYGVVDTNGYTHTTDSTQTVAVRETATNCKINGVTISNKWNCTEYYSNLGLTSADHRALALLVQSDQFVCENSALLGYQDTLELFKGRQYFSDCFISGAVDFLFGSNNTTYFDNCTIHTIYNGSSSNGGYICAFMGCSSGSTDYVDYGTILDGCTFEADTDVTDGTVAIARPWNSYSQVTVMNSTIGGHVSKSGYDSTSSSIARYVSMNAEPTDTYVRFYEYNNTGDGAISEAVNGCEILTADEAANYSDYSIIYAKTNGNVSYTLAWDPINGLEQDYNTYYYFDGSSSDTGTSYTFDTSVTVQGNSTTLGDITIDATTGKFKYNGSNSCQWNAGTTLTLEVAAGTTITVNVYPSYYNYTVTGSVDTTVKIAASNTAYYYFEEAQTVTLTSTDTSYLVSIIVNSTNQTDSATYTGLSLSKTSLSCYVDNTLDLSSVTAYATYSTGYKVDVTSECVIDSSDVDMTTTGSYTVSYTYGETVSNLTVEVEEDTSNGVINETTAILFGTSGNYTSVNNLVYTAVSRDNGTNNSQVGNTSGVISFYVLAGATITISSYKNYTNYTLTVDGVTSENQTDISYSVTATTDCQVILTPTSSNNYLYSIGVTYTLTENATYSFRTDTSTGNEVVSTATTYQSCVGIIADGQIIVDATSGKLDIKSSQWAQFNSGTIITLTVAAGATVTIVCYSTDYTVNGTAATAKTTTITTTATTTIEIVATANTYIDSITVTF